MASAPLPFSWPPVRPDMRRSKRAACVGLFVCALLLSTVSAASTLSGQDPNVPAVPTAGAFSWSGYFYAIGALCLILGALWAVLWLMRRSGKFRFMPLYNTFPRDALRIEAQIPLGQRRGLMVVRFLNKRLLLGLSDQQIHLLSEAEYDGQASADFSKALEAADRQETDK